MSFYFETKISLLNDWFFVEAFRKSLPAIIPSTAKHEEKRQSHTRRGMLLWLLRKSRKEFFCLLCICLVEVQLCWLVRVLPNKKITLPALGNKFRKQRQSTTLAMTATCDSDSTLDPAVAVDANNKHEKKNANKRLICIRHARSEGNEFLAKPGNQWGDPTFCDDATLIDAKLSATGHEQIKERLVPELERVYGRILKDIDLILLSPLTRTLETFEYGVLPALQKVRPQHQGMPPIVAHPLCTERVYTASDTGRNAEELVMQFPFCDFSMLKQSDPRWWYTEDKNPPGYTYREWRPHKEGQWYAVPGEPMEVFTLRMEELKSWIRARPEQTIMLVAHWGVIRYLTGSETKNCEVKLVKWEDIEQVAAS